MGRIQMEMKACNNHPSSHVQVIGAGFGRTGTSSLKKALDVLGYNTYHMTENFKHSHFKFWLRVANKKKQDKRRIELSCEVHPVERNHEVDEDSYHFDEIFKLDERESYTATCDFPAATYWIEQLNQYPQAKVILTKRDPEKWYQSCIDTIFRTMPCSPHCDPLIYWWTWLGIPSTYYHTFFKTVIGQDTFKGNWSKENVIQCYQEHNKKVETNCPKEQLLVFEVAQGWKPLCEFLGKPIPDVPFPHVNDTKDFTNLFRNVRIITTVVMLAIPAISLTAWVSTSMSHRRS